MFLMHVPAFLCLPDDLVIFKHSRIIQEVIRKWKFLEQLCLGGNIKKIRSLFMFCEHRRRLSEHFKALLALGSWDKRENLAPILVQISEHCKHFTGLKIVDASVEELEAYTIVESLPNLKQLCAIESYLKRDSLIKILRDCKNLELLDVRNSEGFDEGDDEISKLASHIEFLCEGSYSLNSRSSFNFSYRLLFLSELKMEGRVARSTRRPAERHQENN
ncbi:putative leucine-rich repeat domain, L domain-containing protein [Rosa chinensis]|uniref:Putative leucine-rich repeat domain, L domain-containing protein n=1 Tax=Rosa chinensis TaxID=74649 RepID=A0A2P6R873_ROSCH|nr:putative leucine-rich repeat domain, L domain-containing protein [Rosa chinensis]